MTGKITTGKISSETLLGLGRQFMEHLLKENLPIEPMVNIASSSEGPLGAGIRGYQFKHDNPAIETMIKSSIIGLIKASRGLGCFDSAFMISEMWFKSYEKAEVESNGGAGALPRPSDCKDRQEGIILSAYDHAGKRSTAIYEIKRDSRGEIVKVSPVFEKEADNLDCWLDEAFK